MVALILGNMSVPTNFFKASNTEMEVLRVESEKILTIDKSYFEATIVAKIDIKISIICDASLPNRLVHLRVFFYT
jgi:hypothetical protein